MYNNGHPPFRPPGGNFQNMSPSTQPIMPPFPPSGQGTPFRPPFPPNMPPGAFPPFPQNFPPGFRPLPPQHQFPPGFPPQSFPPGFPQGFPPQGVPSQTSPPNQQFPGAFLTPNFAGSPPQAPGQGPSPLPSRPPHPGSGVNMYGPRAGLGANGHPGPGLNSFDPGAVGLPRPPHLSGGSDNPNFVKAAVKTTAVFLGGIPNGISDHILTGLIHTCGPVHKINRVTGPSGKPQAFGFAEFEDPEVVLRCLKCLNGVELPDITPQGRQHGTKKTLVVKADEKTKEFLDEYEKNMMRTDHDEEQDESAKRRIATIVKALHDPSADLAAILPSMAASEVVSKPAGDVYEVPAHLKDLDENELPENQRGVVLDQISMFREQAAKREADKKRQEEEREARRIAALTPTAHGGRTAQGPAHGASSSRQFGGQHGQGSTPQGPRGMGNGPQNYNQAPSFVKAESLAGRAGGDMTDEQAEEVKVQQKQRHQEQLLRERRGKVEMRERQRADRLNKEAGQLRLQRDLEELERKAMSETLADWDDDEKASRGREVFFADRGRWRSMRQARRRYEYQADVKDRQVEADEAAALEKESEDFIERQMAEMAELELKQRAAGHLFDDSAPIKLAIAPAIAKSDSVAGLSSTVKVAAIQAKPKPGVSFGGDDDEEEEVRKKRTLIKLDDGLSEADRIAKNNAKLLEIKVGLPTGKEELFALNLEWDALSEDLIQRKLLPFVRSKMIDFLGELEDDDLVQFVLQHIRDKGLAVALVEGLEPVLDDEAEAFVMQLYRLLAFESVAYEAGLSSGSMVV